MFSLAQGPGVELEVIDRKEAMCKLVAIVPCADECFSFKEEA